MKYNTRLLEILSLALAITQVSCRPPDLLYNLPSTKKSATSTATTNISVETAPQNAPLSKSVTINTQKKLIKGMLESSSLNNAITPVGFFFEGAQTLSDQQGLFTLPLDKKNAQISLLICKTFQKIRDDKGEVKQLKIDTKLPYLYYVMQNQDGKNIWITQKLSDDGIIPADTVVMIKNPKYVITVETWDLEAPKNCTLLPKIKIDDSTNAQHAALKCLARTIDLASWHEKVARTEEVRTA